MKENVTTLTLGGQQAYAKDVFVDAVIKPIIANRMNASKGKVAGGESGYAASHEYHSKMINLCASIPSKESEQAYNNEIGKLADRIIAGGEAGVPKELEIIMAPLKDEIATAKALRPNDIAGEHVRNIRIATGENALKNIVKSELISTMSAYMKTNPLAGFMAGGEAGYSLATMRPFQLLETAIQYKNTVKVIYNKLIDTEVFTDRINVQYLRQQWFISYKDADGVEVKKSTVDHYNNMQSVRNLQAIMQNKKVVKVPVTTSGTGYSNGFFDLVKMGVYAKTENLAPEARVTAVYLTGADNTEGTKIDLSSLNQSSSAHAHVINDGSIGLEFVYEVSNVEQRGSVQGTINFNDLSGSILASAGIFSVEIEFLGSNEMYQRSFKMDTVTSKDNFQISYTERIDFSYNPRVNQIFNAALGSDVMAQLLAKGSEHVIHSKEQKTFDLFDNTVTTMRATLARVDAEKKKQVLFCEKTVDASYFVGVPMLDTLKTKITTGLNTLYHDFIAKVNPNSGIGFGCLIAPQLMAYLTAVTPVIAKESIDTTIPGTFAGSVVDSPVVSFSLDSTGQGGLRGIAVKSDKLTGTNITMVPQMLDPNMKNFVLAEQPVLIYSNNEIRNRENVVAPNIHLEAPFTPWSITPSIAYASVSNLGAQEIIPVKSITA